ncbi:UDP-4-amino-4,6-dideoxy-N-acetyl-beta-L-altrosamine transaminase [Sporomusa ovata DSM 2662]|uniref:Bacillosamine/Legionaminic acid biosynthesis aminotransferase PglE 4-keto-6-deoxy-N-Acetyl-D-hexosaminyl-(Lipid carrier) aminotransferase n=1 Tax=Sporomusa ovata TaxID=2378 RepID=A0A0U1KSN8_9FIRM|nr:UDP-4-amino-4,6-dideoxy-N-acetyl-beta-L-altrosamine transaminase [Sporomusa ovata]EQB26356.1 UDP-4-keto-6-deoxy-N-acetylglucosamine 4-aminotransferase [Sporomusa ovata DSM 2662]CQR70436.1 Bacillosamine/Legionaminic acid biosynthesis aminotransferase PglE; 4-keto-6-deoxy-N-Acetyl-D-hexosaminyl-(Lipid carrier) aminotransferase [Sporomusa ovata]
MRDTVLPYGKQWLDEDDIAAVVEVLKSDYLTTGPKIEEFEKAFAQYVGAKYAVTIANGTAALHAACFAAGIQAGEEVITTPITFAASANAVLYCGGTLVFADIDAATYNIDPKEIRKKLTTKTKAIIPVHFTGQPCAMDEISEIAKEYNLTVIEDAAHAVGADYRGKLIGGISDMTTFSFHPVKHITTGEGGMITTNEEVLYKKLLLFRSHGITRDEAMMLDHQGPWYYEQLELGYNYRMTDIQAALGLSQLKKANKFLQRRREIAEMYTAAFKDTAGLTVPFQQDGCNSSWHLYIIRLNLEQLKSDRKEIFNALRRENIGVNVHYLPVYKHPYYQQNGYQEVKCDYSEDLYSRIISLPIFPKMTNQDVQDVISSVKTILERNEK